MPSIGFKCCCLERDFEPKTTLSSKAHYGVKHSLKTVVVISSDFLSDTWNSSDCPLISDVDIMLIRSDIVLVGMHECDVPSVMAELAYIDGYRDDWWARLVSHLTRTDDTPLTEDTALTGNGTLLGVNPRK